MPVKLVFTEVEWLHWSDSRDMIRFVKGRTSSRKRRLFYCACVRTVWGLLGDERSRQAVEASERFADGLESAENLLERRKAGYLAWYEIPTSVPKSPSDDAAAAAFMCANEYLVYASGVPWRVASANGQDIRESKALADMCRDVVGNPFRPVQSISLQDGHRMHSVQALTETIYAQRAFDLMPSLWSELTAAGCADPDVLAHCHEPGPHVRGCWVVDMLLDKR